MRILVDENIPMAYELFGSLGEVVLVPGRDVDAGFPGLEDFDALAIRSVTAVTPDLVDRAKRCRFIGTATIGTDHIDDAYIKEVNARRACRITVASAPGSNAASVADYVFYSLAWVTALRNEPLGQRSLGIIGHGNCGSRVARRARGFGMRVLRHDPPLQEREPAFHSDGLKQVLAADFITCHVPLTGAGESEHPTFHMIGADALALMRPGSLLINSSRGAVVDSRALIAALANGRIDAVLDVFEGEPRPAPELLQLPLIATPHIAGYAVEAKRRGAIVIYEALCRAFGEEPMDTAPLLMQGFAPPHGQQVRFDAAGPMLPAADRAVWALFALLHDIGRTSDELKATIGEADRGALFDRMRKLYAENQARHELASYRVRVAVGGDLGRAVARRLAGFGTVVTDERPHYVLTAD